MKKYLILLGILALGFAPMDTAFAVTQTKTKTAQVVEQRQIKVKTKPISAMTGIRKKPVTIVFSDIDGTIIPFEMEKGSIPTSATYAYEKLKDKNIPLVLATGRSTKDAKKIAEKIGLKDFYVIGQQGAEILNPKGEIIYEDGICAKDVKAVVAEIKKFNEQNNQHSKPFVYKNGQAYVIDDFELPHISDKAIKLKSFDELGDDYKSVKIGICEFDKDKLFAIRNHLAKKFPKYNVVVSSICYCDVSSKTATKGNAIKKVASLMGYNLKYAAVLGDSENDISMIKMVRHSGGVAVAVENALPSVKNAAEYSTTAANKAGFLNAVNYILINNNLLNQK